MLNLKFSHKRGMLKDTNNGKTNRCFGRQNVESLIDSVKENYKQQLSAA